MNLLKNNKLSKLEAKIQENEMQSNKMLSIIVFMLSIMNVNAFICPFWTKIPTGSVGIVYIDKALQTYTLEPGFHWYTDFLDKGFIKNRVTCLNPISTIKIVEMNIRPQLDEVHMVKCTTKDTQNINFPVIKVWNQLAQEDVIHIVKKKGDNYDDYYINSQIRPHIEEMCSKMILEDIYIEEFSDLNEKILENLIEFQIKEDSKLKITRVTVAKPLIPDEVKKNYEQITIEKTSILAEVERQKRRLKEEETNRMVEEQQKLKEKSLAELENLKMISNAEAQAKKAQIEYEADAQKKKSEADVQAYEKKSQAEANAKLYTPEYIQVHYQQHVLANTDATYFGKDLPQAYIMGPQINK